MAWHTWRPRPGRAVLGLLVLAGALAAAGCSGNRRVTVEGTVTYKGAPVPEGYLVKFLGPGDHLAVGIIDDKGTYAVTDVPPGEVKVTVEPDAGMPPTLTKPVGNPGGPAAKFSLPEKYTREGLSYTITAGTRQIDLKLE